MAVTNGTCVSFCNQPKAPFRPRASTRVIFNDVISTDVVWRGCLSLTLVDLTRVDARGLNGALVTISLPQGVTPVCRCLHPFCVYLATSRESKAHFVNASQHVPISNRFPVIQPVISQVRYISTFLHILASLATPLGQSPYLSHDLKEDLMLVKRLAAYTHLSSTISEI